MIKSTFDQVSEYKVNHSEIRGGKLTFTGFSGKDFYNPTTPFFSDGKEIMAVRVEKRESFISDTMFFENKGDSWQLIEDAPVLPLQDPFVTIINGEIILGGVYLVHKNGEYTGWYTYFYRGKTIYDLQLFFVGPSSMKDIRLVELENGRIGVFSRPSYDDILQKYGHKAIIGYYEADSLDCLNVKDIINAPHILNMFGKGDWGGVNQAILLANGDIGVVGHKCYLEDADILHYTAMSFIFNRNEHTFRELKIIATRDNFPKGETKEPRLSDVVFSSGVYNGELYAGLSDCEIGKIKVGELF
jgi:hypothetical protein